VIARRSSLFSRRLLAATTGIAVIYLGGLAQLSILNLSIVRAIQLGVTPFAALDLVKAFVAAAITGARPRSDR
jgi:biotin transporter BioY